MTHVIAFTQLDLDDSERVGRKAAVLARLRRSGYPVPDGFAIDWQAAAAGESAASMPGFVAEVASALAELDANGVGVAVRSSGIEEDLAGKSFAGQYESVLGVKGIDAVLAAVDTCWRSARAQRVAVYRGSAEAEETAAPRMGVLVQRMVDARAAGAAFSVNPVTGDPEEAVVSAVSGLAEQLMDGSAVADEWAVRAGEAALRSGTGAAGLTPGEAAEIAELAARVAAEFEAPQDIEWAIDEDGLWLVQARPITTLAATVAPVPIPVVVPAGFSVRDARVTAPWTPVQESIFLPVFAAAAPGVFAFTTGNQLSVHAIGGWIYTTTAPDTMPALIERLERIAGELADDAPQRLVAQWHATLRREFTERIVALRAVSFTLPELDDAAFRAHFTELLELFTELHMAYFRLTGAGVCLNGQLGVLAAELLGWSAADTLALRGGLTGAHMAAAEGLGALARLAAAKPQVRTALTAGTREVAGRLSEIDEEFAAAFADYVRAHGHRTLGFDLSEPTFAEQPEILLNLVLAQIDAPFDLDRERAALRARIDGVLTRARAGLADKTAEQRAQFDRAVAAADEVAPVRDEKVYLAVSAWALVRYAVLDLGRRLVARTVIDRIEDVFYLDHRAALAALTDTEDRTAAVRDGRGRQLWAATHPGPEHYGTPPQPLTLEPGMTPPSAAAARVMDIATWSMSLFGAQRGEASADDSTLVGVAAAAGRYRGPARIVLGAGDFGKIRAGDVLVCPETTAQWSVVFPSLGALIADNGSLLSHPAIIAREYGIPAVVAAAGATERLRDGQLVEVDGTTGAVRVLDAEGGAGR
ncbi:pyruvate, phosphate dikinase [Nocardia brasiliensis]|uniref:Pyruvate, phosphate dikinase n=1 Tax=Nocardia brasiliensis TaxID=37326 RepID=A0A6G9XQU7_NOCBR|nr:PEP/pyruvate-binding domain-containing protein [Nocardia brasiliensis]QIS03275.1 pyruvate, phosphate dikinase [Nocardia brasiliensis]